MPKRIELDASLVLGDMHVPCHSVPAMSLVFAVLDRFSFRDVGSIGDMTDQKAASRHAQSNRHPDRTIQYDVDAGVEMATRLKIAAGVPCWVTLGNHDEWWRREAKWRHVDSCNLARRLKSEAGWLVTPYERSRKLTGSLDATHDFGAAGKGALMQAPSSYGKSVVFGHTHRGGTWYEGSSCGSMRAAMNVGWLGEPDRIEYAHNKKIRATTAHGVGLVYYGQGDRFHLSFSPFFTDARRLWCCIHGEWISVAANAADPRAVSSPPRDDEDPGLA